MTISVLALLLERIIEIRTGNTWRNVRDLLGTIKVVEYDRGGYRIQQTSELRINANAILTKLGLPAPPKLIQIAAVQPDEPTDSADGDNESDADAAAAAPA